MKVCLLPDKIFWTFCHFDCEQLELARAMLYKADLLLLGELVCIGYFARN